MRLRFTKLAEYAKIAYLLAVKGEFPLTREKIDYHIRGMPLKRRYNLFLSLLGDTLNLRRPVPFPPYFQVEVTNFCNLRCPACPAAIKRYHRKPRCLKLDVFKKFIDQAGDYLVYLSMWGIGEPLMHPDFCSMVEYAHKKGVLVVTSTNGHYLTPELSERLVKSGIDTVVISVDGATQEIYEKYRVGGNLEQVKAGIRNLVAAKSRLKSKTPLVNMRFIVMSHNENQLNDIKALAADLKADVFSLRSFGPIFIDDSGIEHEFIPSEKRLRRYKYENGKRVNRRDFVCRLGWSGGFFVADSKIALCEADFMTRQALGNLELEDFKDIWF
ncbi:hypothetical protein COV22_02105, partial [Candidatus Woesearchaeota archaeon CG10_big_fil_rev_8_21_14_0_10_47_5]